MKGLALTFALVVPMVQLVAQAPPTCSDVSFGALPSATFGGNGIPNSAVVQRSCGGVTMGLAATPRFASPALTNDGAGTYFAMTGQSDPLANPARSLWNFSFDIQAEQGVNLSDYTFQLLYDMDPAVGNGSRGVLLDPAIQSFEYQNSQNLGFGFLGTDFPGAITAPAFTAFDPNANGTYNFTLEQYLGGQLLSSIDMTVVVGDGGADVVPEPASMTLLATGLVGMAAARRRKRTA